MFNRKPSIDERLTADEATKPETINHGRRDFLKLSLLTAVCYPLSGCNLDYLTGKGPTQEEVDMYIERLVNIKKAEYDVVTSEILMRETNSEYNKEKYNTALKRFNGLRTKEETPEIEDSYRRINALMGENSKSDVINRFLLDYGYLYVKKNMDLLRDNTYFLLKDESEDKKSTLKIRFLDKLESLSIGKIISVEKQKNGKLLYTFKEILPHYNSREGKNYGSFVDSIGNAYKKAD